MPFCTNCDNTYDLAKTVPNNSQQIGSSDTKHKSESPITVSSLSDDEPVLDKLIRQILNKDDVNISSTSTITLTQLSKNQSYNKLTAANKEIVFTKINAMINNKDSKQKGGNNDKAAYFICNNCGNFEPIAPGTLILKKIVGVADTTVDNSILSDMIYEPYLPRTRNYICKNKDCVSHKDHSQREAVFKRVGNTFNVVYTCVACKTVQ